MSKRKRADGFDAPEIEDQALRLKVSRLKAKISQGTKALHSALKLARGFERQKLGRRQKNASSEPQTLLRLREEVIVLKQLQLEKTARSRLVKNLAKTKRIKEHPAFIALYGLDYGLGNSSISVETNVVGRLFNSNPVKQALPEIMKSIYGVLGIPQVALKRSEQSTNSATTTSEKKERARSNSRFDGFSGDDSADDVATGGEDLSGSELEGRDLFENAKDRLASSDDESDGEDVDYMSLVPQKEASRASNSGQSVTRDQHPVSLSPIDDSESDNGRLLAAPQRRPNPETTAFLPSLSMGGYYSGSETEDDAPQYHGPALPKERKNRRGQQARQRLAELKYGKSAKHLGTKKIQDERAAGWDPKRGAVEQGGRSRDRSRTATVGQKSTEYCSTAKPSRASHPDKPKSKDDQGPIHPSWEAAKKRKMQDQTQASFQGKKVTFD